MSEEFSWNPSSRIKHEEIAELERQKAAFLLGGGKITQVGANVFAEVPAAENPALAASRERAKAHSRGRKGCITEKQRKVMSAIREAMGGELSISFASALKAVKGTPESLRGHLNNIVRHGYFDFDGETITARGAK